MAHRINRLWTTLNICTRWVHRMPSSKPYSEGQTHTHSMVQQTPLLDLPSELWLIVMEHLGPPELYVLGCTSRHLNSVLCDFLWHSHFPRDSDDQGRKATNLDLTVHVVSRRRWRSLDKTVGVGSPTQKRDRSIDDLDLLSIVLNPQSIHKVTCKFNVPNTPGDKPFVPELQLVRHDLSHDYQQLSRCISRLPPNLSHVNLTLGPGGFQDRKDIDQAVWLTRTKTLNELFNVCIQKGCSSFHVSGGSVLSGMTILVGPLIQRWGNLVHIAVGKRPSLASIFSEKTTMIGVGWKVLPMEKLEEGLHPPSLMIANKTVKGKANNKPNHPREIVQSQLTSLEIDNPLLVVPPFSNWTYQLVATSSHLTTLTLSNLDALHPSFLEIVLTWLLEALKIQNTLRCLTIKSDGTSDPGRLYIHPMLWFIHALGQAGGAAASSPTALEELNFVGWRNMGLDPTQVHKSLHKSFDGRVTSRTLKRMKLHWAILLALLGLNAREEYTREMEATVLELVKERFRALEQIEFIADRAWHVVKVISGGKI